MDCEASLNVRVKRRGSGKGQTWFQILPLPLTNPMISRRQDRLGPPSTDSRLSRLGPMEKKDQSLHMSGPGVA